MLLTEKRRDLCLFPMLWTSAVVLDTKDVDFLLSWIRKKCVVVVCVFFIFYSLFWVVFTLLGSLRVRVFILDLFTSFVPSWVTCKISHISFAFL